MQGPKVVLFEVRVSYDWFTPILMRNLRERYGTRFVLLLSDRSRVPSVKAYCADNDKIVFSDEIRQRIPATPQDRDSVFARARAYEERYGVNYMRDIIQQDRGLACYFLDFSPNSAFATAPADSLCDLYAKINFYFDWYEELYSTEGIDLSMIRPSGIDITPGVHVAMRRGIVVSTAISSRYKSTITWTEGGYLGTDLLKSVYNALPTPAEPTPVDDVSLTPDGAELYAHTDRDHSWRLFFRQLAMDTIDRGIFLLRDIKRMRRGKRLSYFRVQRQRFAKFFSYWRLARMSERNLKAITAQPYILFAMPQEPEFNVQSLAREFNNTHTFIEQLALNLPAGYRLVIKEHVTNIGNRHFRFYKTLQRLPNLTIAHIGIRGIELARHAAAVSTIGGTTGIEGTMFGKQAVVFGLHTGYDFLPNVQVVKSFHDLSAILREALRPRTPEEVMEIRRAGTRYQDAIAALSFDAAGTAVFRGAKKDLQPEEERKAIDLLVRLFNDQRQRADRAA